MSDTIVDLKSNTNFVCLKNLQDEYVVPRTNLSAVDMVVANGLTLNGNVLSVSIATADDITYGTTGHLVDAVVLSACLADKAAAFSVGDLLENTSGTLNRKRYMNIVQEASIPTRSVTPIGSTAAQTALVLEPGNAYKITATSTSKWLATTAAFKAEQNTWGLEGHIELFIASTGYVHTDDNVVLATPLEPDAVNNCTVRFHDGKAIISVEDTIAGYIVLVAGGTEGTSTGGSLYYGLANNVGEYIGFNDALAGTVIDLAGVATYNGEKHVVGNGYTDTIISGSINCTNKTTFANLSFDDVQVVGGTMTLGDVYIRSGSTVAVATSDVVVEGVTTTVPLGSMAVERVTGSGSESVIDLGGTHVVPKSDIYASGVVFSGGSAVNGGAIDVASVVSSVRLTGCTFANNSVTTGYAGALNLYVARSVQIVDCLFIDNDNTRGVIQPASLLGSTEITGCTFGLGQNILFYYNSGANVTLSGTNKTLSTITANNSPNTTVTLSSGATLDLTGNTNATPINPGGGITFEAGGATVLYDHNSLGSSMANSVSYMYEGGALSLSNTNAVTVDRNYPLHASGCSITFTNVAAPIGAGGGGSSVLLDCSLYTNVESMFLTGYNNTGTVIVGGTVHFNKMLMGANTAAVANLTILDGATIDFSGVSGGYIVQCQAGTLTVGSNCTFITSGGSSVSINGGMPTTGKRMTYDGRVVE